MQVGGETGADNRSAQFAPNYINLDGEEHTIPTGDDVSTPQNPSEDASIREENTEELLLKRKRQRTSKVWEEFVEITLPDGKKKAECIHCKTKSELDLYLEEGVYREQGQGGRESFNALEWWNVHKLKYRVLSKMAMDVLAIPISTVASEATFSAGGRVIDPYRSSLASDTVQMLICGGDWIRQLYGIKKKLKKEEIPTEVLLPAVRTD